MDNKKEIPELDLVFVCDCTGSMGSYIASAKQNITSIIEQIQASESRDVQFALISYRDHPPQDSSYVTKIFDFTPSVRKAKEYVDTMAASGGGDAPEAVAAALHAALNLPYRKKATKIVVIVADAPPHGLTSFIRDGFPDGSPDGADPIIDARTFAEREIVLYAVGCEPIMGRSPFARDFFKAISQITGGRYISLGNAQVLPKVIIGGAEEEMHLNKLSEEIEKEAAIVKSEAEEKKETIDEEALYARVTERLQAKGIQTTQLEVDDIGDSEDSTPISRKIAECDDLKAVKAMLDKEERPATASRSAFAGKKLRKKKAKARRGSDDDDEECEAEEKKEKKEKEKEKCEKRSSRRKKESAKKEKEETEEIEEGAAAPRVSMAKQEARINSAAISYSQVSRMMNKKKYSKAK